MKALQEDLWAALPGELEPYALALRHDFLVRHLERRQRVLEVGCGEGTFTAILAEAGAAPLGIDISERALERARARHPGLDFRLAREDAPLAFDDASFDVVWASEVLAHVGDTARFV